MSIVLVAICQRLHIHVKHGTCLLLVLEGVFPTINKNDIGGRRGVGCARKVAGC